MNGYELPIDTIISIKALSATGLSNQLYKVVHGLYLARWIIPWTIWTRPGVTRPLLFDFFKAVRKNEAANLPIGAAGFCWGGKWVTELCWDHQKADDGQRLIDCGFSAHPSMLKYPQDIDMVVLPYAIAASEIDFQMTPENAKQTRGILEAKTARTKGQGVEHEFVLYEGAHHGFAVRADEDEKHEAEQGRKAEAQAIAWFSRWFSKPPPTNLA